MQKLTFSILVSLLFLVDFNYKAQVNKCGTTQALEKRLIKDSSLQGKIQKVEKLLQEWISNHPQSKNSQTIITIPVVVHVLWNTPAQNISNEQIQSQIDILNKDFRLTNSDSLLPSHPFRQYSSDAGISFCLATKDPTGNPSSGITRTFTDSTFFSGIGFEKFTGTGGKNNWDPEKYLNVWVCNLGGATLGYSSLPADLLASPNEDGIVCRHQAFGNIGTAGTGGFPNNGLGRTMTHEVGHWLNLKHIWGDYPPITNPPLCGDDLVADTKAADHANYGCHTFPFHISNPCGTDANGEMYMNYMDYSDDACLVMFTAGQASRMQAVLNTSRVGLLTSNICPPVGLNEINLKDKFKIYPNPSSGIITANFNQSLNGEISIKVINVLGITITNVENVSNTLTQIDLSELNNGIYYLQIIDENINYTKKIFISK